MDFGAELAAAADAAGADLLGGAKASSSIAAGDVTHLCARASPLGASAMEADAGTMRLACREAGKPP